MTKKIVQFDANKAVSNVAGKWGGDRGEGRYPKAKYFPRTV